METIKQQHQHREAFMHMTYRCKNKKCRHELHIWNGRDGRAPFIVSCKVCHIAGLQHIRTKDRYDPEYIPDNGDLVWIDVPPEVRRIMQQMTAHLLAEYQKPVDQDLLERHFPADTPYLLEWTLNNYTKGES